jgi:hypothetical protein
MADTHNFRVRVTDSAGNVGFKQLALTIECTTTTTTTTTLPPEGMTVFRMNHEDSSFGSPSEYTVES